ncbi:MAG TPA: sensor domain-containing diguanylate cyclase, partial [Burkholderiaceae bacterium]|nr:sensor domain-containing diguanylate cyclase [Burkholderiaceae bacterium]
MQAELSRWSGQCADPEVEAAFRAQYAADSLRHVRAAVVIGAAAYVLFLANDVLRFGWGSELLFRLPLRLVVAVAAAWILLRLRKTDDFRRHDRWLGVYGVLVAVSYSVITAFTYAPGIIVPVSMVVLILAAFIGLPTSFAWNVTVGVACLIGFPFALAWNRDPSTFGIAMLLVFCAASSALLLRQMNALRRRAYLAWRREREARDALQATSHSRDRLFAAVPVPFALARLSDGRILQANDIATQSLRIAPGDLERLCIGDLLVNADDHAALQALLSQDGAIDRFELCVRRTDGTELDALLSGSRVDYDGEPCVLLGLTDVSDLKRLERELYRQAAFDPLTGLANRRSFMEHLGRAFAHARRSAQPLSLLYLDIDHFKAVNDAHGHTAGDEVLRMFAEIVTAGVRADDVVARLGGEEFAVLLPNATLE